MDDHRNERVATVVLVSYVRWAGVALGVIQAFLTSDPRPIGGPWIVFGVTGLLAAYNIPAMLIRRAPARAVEPLILFTVAGDLLVCTGWTLLNANDVYSTTYAIYTLVAIEAAVFYQWRGTALFVAGFVASYAVLYAVRAAVFGFPAVASSVIYRSVIVLMVAVFTGAITSQSQKRRRALTREAQRYEHLLDAMSDLGQGVLILQDGRIAYANDACCRVSRYTLEELRSMTSFFDLIAHDARSVLAARLPLRPEDEINIGMEGESTVLTKDRRRIPIDWSAEPIEAEGRQQVVVIVRDATERVHAIRRIEEARDTAQAASAAKSDHLSRMSHELRTPLTVISGYAELLEMELSQPSQRGKVEAIVKASDHLLSLVNDVLDISRATAITPETLEPVDVAAAVEECTQLFEARARLRWITIRTELSKAARYVIADPRWVNEVLLNLLSNAVNYNREWGEVIVATSLRAGDSVRIAVTDTGPGIDPKDFEALWQPFERLGAERTTIEGTGLGLSVCKRFVEAMGGSVGVTSKAGSGSTFWVDLPVAPAGDVVAEADSADVVGVSSRARAAR